MIKIATIDITLNLKSVPQSPIEQRHNLLLRSNLNYQWHFSTGFKRATTFETGVVVDSYNELHSSMDLPFIKETETLPQARRQKACSPTVKPS
jgi:hypothetical protein